MGTDMRISMRLLFVDSQTDCGWTFVPAIQFKPHDLICATAPAFYNQAIILHSACSWHRFRTLVRIDFARKAATNTNGGSRSASIQSKLPGICGATTRVFSRGFFRSVTLNERGRKQHWTFVGCACNHRRHGHWGVRVKSPAGQWQHCQANAVRGLLCQLFCSTLRSAIVQPRRSASFERRRKS